ncbi:MAG: hypothetical protein U5K74_06140, partial [Gemmatimonadaceae bacterium]|nr:hypothetical protein [Gemmatimonadaceae bacterium]
MYDVAFRGFLTRPIAEARGAGTVHARSSASRAYTRRLTALLDDVDAVVDRGAHVQAPRSRDGGARQGQAPAHREADHRRFAEAMVT